jgi:stage II sporulation protein D
VSGRSGSWLAAILLGATPVAGEGPAADDRLRALAAEADRAGTIVRIAVASGSSVRLASPGPFRIVDPARGSDAWRPSYRGEVAVVVEGGPVEAIPDVWRVQTGSYGSEAAARAELDRLRAAFGEPGVVRRDPDRGTWRVRIGESADREGLSGLVSSVRDSGIAQAFLVAEPARTAEGITLRLVDSGWESRPIAISRLAAVPEPGGFVSVDGTRYRGVVEIRAGRDGRALAVNWVEAESYLRGVVPSELGPELWPRLEAQKAQAVAARTYFRANLGQFAEDGYDLCATPRCQVYGGADVEHPLSDRAVLETRGQILTYGGKPITALYTSTCGGHTEDVSNVFPEQEAPYLRGVPCRDEEASARGGAYTLSGARIVPVLSETGEDVTRHAALLAAMGVLETTDPVRLREPLDGPGLREITVRLARAAGRPVPAGPAPRVTDLVSACRAVVEDLGWVDRADVILEAEDVPAILRDREAIVADERGTRALAALVAWADLRPGKDGRFGARERVSAARLAPSLARIAEGYAADGLLEGTLRDVRGDRIRLARGAGEIEWTVVRRPYLFSAAGAAATPAARLDLWPGDRVAVRAGTRGEVDFLELRAPLRGASDDRSSTVHSWTVRRDRVALDEAVGSRLGVGTLLDLEVVRRGVSGRIVEMRVLGTSGTASVRGFDVRNLFGLRESLTSVEIQRDPEGRVAAAVFAGRGWGHGVGLCQVGAYGMALRGANYVEILRHYYRGAVLDPAGPVPP